MSKFVPLAYDHQALPLTRDDIYNVGMIMMQCQLIDQWPSYPSSIHIKCITTVKVMPNRIALRLPPLDLRKKKSKVPPHSTPMPYQGPKDNVSLHPISYDWSRYFRRDVATKTITLKLDTEFDQNDAMLLYFKDMYENSHLASTLDYDKKDNSNHMRMVQILRPTKIYFNNW
ncbi:hypothetical protein GYH30_031590 [Glycine max]|nr:hypothetical protein GYH30_031590 [Glycine max]